MVDYTKADGYVVDAKGRRQYVNRDDANLVPGTEIDADDHNQLRNDVVNAIAQSGITPNNDDDTQLYQAIVKIADEREAAGEIGFTPVEQGGIDGLTDDKVQIGNSANGLAAYVSGKFSGVFAYTSVAAIYPVAIGIDQTNLFPWFSDNKGKFYNLATREWVINAYATTTALNREITRAKGAESDLQAAVNGKQPAGDYATNAALTNEVTARANAVAALDGAKVNRAGDTMTGSLSAFNSPTLTDGVYNYSPGFRSYTNSRAGFTLFSQDKVGDGATACGVLVYEWNGQQQQYWWFGPDGSIGQSSKGNVAYVSQIPTDYISQSTYQADFDSGDSRIHDGPYSKRTQHFRATASAGDYITFPAKMGSVDACTVQAEANTDYNCKGFNTDNNGTYLHINGGGTNVQVTVLVSGTKL
ncbi:hypothetical protein HK16_10570 [Acetobacter senegalensis]|uniref:Tail fiber protein n=2 Tax=Acetobacter TaxID=434 RepID=A0A252EIQ0_9PROT|nr:MULTISPECIES: hypothetical protein [Acetobacter]ATJ89437.1 hypothetical protein CIW82_00570 [Acetobacter tropicalis]OUL66320.1 hypothetical protein HK16_10570 [Acetobacter senegalensis]